MRLYLPSFSKKFSLMIFNQKYFFQASFITMVMGFGMNLHASEVSQDEKNIEKLLHNPLSHLWMSTVWLVWL